MVNRGGAVRHDWLAMLFLGADNDLFEFGQNLLTEAQRVGSSDRVAVVAQHDPIHPDMPTGRGQILPGGWDKKRIGLTGGDAKAIIDFVKYAKNEFPADKKILVLWDHGNGWQNVHTFESLLTTTLPIEEAFEANAEDPGINILCFDSCLMAMIEVACQLRNHVQFIVASENVVPADSGWPYDMILNMLKTRPEMNAEQVVPAIVNGFSGSYNGSDQPVTLSALKLSEVDETVKAIDRLSRELIAACVNGAREKVLFARRYSQSFGNPDYIDLVSFCNELERLLPGTGIETAARGVRERVRHLVVGITRSSTRSVSAAHGLSIYFPDRPISPKYHLLDFAQVQTCMWASFLEMIATKIPAQRPFKPSGEEASPHRPHQH